MCRCTPIWIDKTLRDVMSTDLIVVPLELDPRRCLFRFGKVAEVPDADGTVEGGGEDDILGQRVELDQLQIKQS